MSGHSHDRASRQRFRAGVWRPAASALSICLRTAAKEPRRGAPSFLRYRAAAADLGRSCVHLRLRKCEGIAMAAACAMGKDAALGTADVGSQLEMALQRSPGLCLSEEGAPARSRIRRLRGHLVIGPGSLQRAARGVCEGLARGGDCHGLVGTIRLGSGHGP
jgi:hypothetical protein